MQFFGLFICGLLATCFLASDGARFFVRRRGMKSRLRRQNFKATNPLKSGRRIIEVNINQDDLRAMCETKIAPGISSRRTMQTTFGGKGSSYLEGQGIDRKLLCNSKLYKTIKKEGSIVKHETEGTAIVSNQNDVNDLLDNPKKERSDKEFNVETSSAVKIKHDKGTQPIGEASSVAAGSASGLNGTALKSKAKSYTQVRNQGGAGKKNVMEMDHMKETDFELEI